MSGHLGSEALNELFADEPARLTVARVADLMDVSPKAVYQWIKRREVPAYEFPSGSYFILRDELREVLASRRTWSQPADPEDPSA